MPAFSASRETPWRKTFMRYAMDVLDQLNLALAEEHDRNGLTRAAVAEKLGVHRSEVTKLLGGRRRNMTMESIAALAWALDRDIEFRLVGDEPHSHRNSSGPLSPLVGGKASSATILFDDEVVRSKARTRSTSESWVDP